MNVVEFFVQGLPVTKGSVVAFQSSSGKTVVRSDSPKLKGWEREVGKQARISGAHVTLAAVSLRIVFILPRPKLHFRNNGTLKPNLGKNLPISKHDLDKLARAVLDGLTGVAYEDDGQVVLLHAAKRFSWARQDLPSEDPIGAAIRIEGV